MNRKIITQSKLKKILHYNPDTGVFTRFSDRNNKFKKGMIAGWKTKEGYIRLKIDYNTYRAHRLAYLYMTGNNPKEEIDHINHNGYDNRWINLRSVTALVNSKNRGKNKNNTSGATGVGWVERKNRWRARIMLNGKSILIGDYININDAILDRKLAEKKYGFHKNHGS